MSRVLDLVRRRLGLRALRVRVDRLVDRAWIIAQAAIGAALAWGLAHDVLGHPTPFFAPVTAMVCLGLTYGNRVSRVIELSAGVAVGILVGDLLVQVFGTGIWQIAVVVTLAMSLAVLLGVGQLLMLQAGIQGVIVTTLVAGADQAVGRWVDALVGGGVALVITLLAPSWTAARRPRQQAAAVTRRLSEVLRGTAQALHRRDREAVERLLGDARGLQRDHDLLRESVAEGLAASRAPGMRRNHRAGVQVILDLLDPLDYALRNARVLVRRAETALFDGEPLPPSYVDLVGDLSEAELIAVQLEGTGPISPAARQALEAVMRRSTQHDPDAGLSTEVVRAQVRSIVVDLLMLGGVPAEQARGRVPPGH